jgi:quercetin dioxygenase-like cupin family protein
MRRALRVVPLVVLLVGGLLGSLGVGPVHAQEATPEAGMMAPEGVTFTPLGVAPGITLPSPVDLTVARATFAPGAGFPLDASDPEGALVIMESGALTIRVEEVDWTISRGGALQQAMGTPNAEPDLSGILEAVAMGAEATLQAGDVAYVPGSITGEVRNDGQEPATVLLVLTDAGGTMMGQAATPTP